MSVIDYLKTLNPKNYYIILSWRKVFIVPYNNKEAVKEIEINKNNAYEILKIIKSKGFKVFYE